MAVIKKPGVNLLFFEIAFFSAVFLALETVLFHLMEFVWHAHLASLVIGYSLLGVCIGALLATKVRDLTKKLFVFCCFGTAFFLPISVFLVLWFPSSGLFNLVLAIPFVWPALFVSVAYRCKAVSSVYFLDMLGAFFGVLLIIFLFIFLKTETVILLLSFLLCLAGLLMLLQNRLSRKILFFAIFFTFLFGSLFLIQSSSGFFDSFYFVNCNDSVDEYKIFCKEPKLIPVSSYDNLIGRIDVLQLNSGEKNDYYWVAYNGFINDHFTLSEGASLDRRVVNALFSQPSVYVLGTSGEGILKSIKKMTLSEKIFGSEINPAIIKIMQKDFLEESNFAYSGINAFLGNGLFLLQETSQKFDIITLMNTHSTQSISRVGAPDFLHTIESYSLFFDRLTENGFLMFEERPENETGKLALYRLIRTQFEALKQMGFEDPSSHFFIYFWHGNTSKKIVSYSPDFYVSILLKKNPITAEERAKLIEWIKKKESHKKNIKTAFLKEYYEIPEFTFLFRELSRDSLDSKYSGFDLSVLTNDRPYPAHVDTAYPEARSILFDLGLFSGILIAGLIAIGFSTKKSFVHFGLSSYIILIGIGFFLIELAFMQSFQRFFISPTIAFLAVLGTLLISAGFGGHYLRKQSTVGITLLLLPVLFGTLLAYRFLPLLITAVFFSAIIILLTAITGFLMGHFFASGLQQAKKQGLVSNIPLYFGISGLAGIIGVALSLFLSVWNGFQFTIFMAAICYIAAGIILFFISKKSR